MRWERCRPLRRHHRWLALEDRDDWDGRKRRGQRREGRVPGKFGILSKAKLPLRLLPVGNEFLFDLLVAAAPHEVADEAPPLIEEDGEEEDGCDGAERDDRDADNFPLAGTRGCGGVGGLLR